MESHYLREDNNLLSINIKIKQAVEYANKSSRISRECRITLDLENYNIKIIPKSTIAENTLISNVVFPESLRIIDENSFSHCSSLKRINFKNCNKLEIIGNNAFINCYIIKSLDFSSCTKLKMIGKKAFRCNFAIKNINFENCRNLEIIGQEAFYKCNYLTIVDLSKCYKLKKIQSAAFQCCHDLTTFISPPNLIEIESQVFASCSSLENIDFVPSLRIIGPLSFQNCRIRKTFKLPNHIRIIDPTSFDGRFDEDRNYIVDIEGNEKLREDDIFLKNLDEINHMMDKNMKRNLKIMHKLDDCY